MTLNSMKPVALVGLSMRYPGMTGPAEFFNSCLSPHPRLTRLEHSVASPFLQNHARGKPHPYRISNDKYGSIRSSSWIDSRRFRVPPSDIEGDPSAFLCLQVASEALIDFQNSRDDDCIPRQKTGIVIGRGDHPHRGIWSGLQGGLGFEVIRDLLLERPDLFSSSQVDHVVETLQERMQPYPTPSIASSLVSNVIAGLVSNRLDLQGPNYLVDAACTSAIVAIQQAIRSLYSGETDLMLVGAAQATMALPVIQLFSNIGAISTSDIQPFNNAFDGTLLSEGVGFVALKRLEDALADQDRIYSIIRGVGLASDGNDSSILAPSQRGQVMAMNNTYASLDDIDPDDIGFLEAHATGINLGDQTELASIQEVFCPQNRKRPLALGALKSIIGHCIPASGIASLIRASYAVAFGIYPASRCDQPMDQLQDIDNGVFLPSKHCPWYEQPNVLRRAAINCFGFGGINGHLVLEQAPLLSDHHLLRSSRVLLDDAQQKQPDELVNTQITGSKSSVSTNYRINIIGIAFTGEDDLKSVLSDAISVIDAVPNGECLCLDLSSNKSSKCVFRLGFVNRDLSVIRTKIEALCDHPENHVKYSRPVPDSQPDLAVMLPGESVIGFGHLSELARYIPSVKALLEFVDESSNEPLILGDILHPAWSALLSDDEIYALQQSANHHDLATKILFVVSIAYSGILRSWGISASSYVGHSTGEINALMLAGGMQAADSKDISAMLRSFEELYADPQYLEDLVEGLVVLVGGISDQDLSTCLENNEDLFLVSDNSSSHRLVFSRYKTIDQVADLFAAYGAFVLPTQLDRAYHTPINESSSFMMRKFYEQLSFSKLHADVYSCCSTDRYPAETSEQIDLLVRQWSEPVRFRQTLMNMYRDGYRCFLELNATKTLLGFAESTFQGNSDVDLLSTGTVVGEQAIDSLAEVFLKLWVYGFDVQWSQWNAMFVFDEPLTLPAIVRPPTAVTIPQELHKFNRDDYTAAWKYQSNQESQVTNSSALTPSITTNPEPLNPSLSKNADVLVVHQQAMRHLLESVNNNTRSVLDKINQISSS